MSSKCNSKCKDMSLRKRCRIWERSQERRRPICCSKTRPSKQRQTIEKTESWFGSCDATWTCTNEKSMSWRRRHSNSDGNATKLITKRTNSSCNSVAKSKKKKEESAVLNQTSKGHSSSRNAPRRKWPRCSSKLRKSRPICKEFRLRLVLRAKFYEPVNKWSKI